MQKYFFDIIYNTFILIFGITITTKLILLFIDTINIQYDNNDYLHLVHKNNKWVGKMYEKTRICFSEYTLNCKKNGYCKITYNNGNIWQGYFKNDLEDGDFICKFKNNNIVLGSFVAGKRNGKWITKKANGDTFYYSYINNIKDCYVTIKYSNGDMYNGMFRNNNKNGLGIMRHKNENVSIGNYCNGMKFGTGFLQLRDGRFMECNYKNNLLDGKCILHDFSGEELTINYKNGKINNPCSLFCTNGNKYVGFYDDNFEKNGIGIYYDKISNKSFIQYYSNNNTKSVFWFHGDHTNFLFDSEFKIKNKLSYEEKEQIYCYVKMDFMYKPVILNCGHKFCLYFLKSWKNYCTMYTCPLCRQKIINIKNDSNSEKLLLKCKFEIDNKKISIHNIIKYYDFISGCC